MKNTDQLGETVRTRREGLGLTQRSLAQKLGVESSHVAFIVKADAGSRRLNWAHVWQIFSALIDKNF
jgi:transcriptional regulator with XRE-family HTH domain